VMNTLFDNTTTTRRQFLLTRFERHSPDGCFVMIEQSPAKVSKSFLTARDETVQQRAQESLAALNFESDAFWNELSGRNNRAATTFRGLGIEQSADLLWQGYLNAMCNSHTVLGYPLLPVPPREQFRQYVRDC